METNKKKCSSNRNVGVKNNASNNKKVDKSIHSKVSSPKTVTNLSVSKSKVSANDNKKKHDHGSGKSSIKYFEEELREQREMEYNCELREAMKRRKLWKQFQKALEKDIKKVLVSSSGPDWWQEPSRNQIALAMTLGDVIKADKEEGVTGRTRQWLLDLGVVTRLTPKQVRACMRSSLLNPTDFLLDVHDEVISIQRKKRGKGKLETPFSLDERLLLTAVCVLQLPALLTMLHYILPPPKPLPNNKFVQELLYGDLSDESIRYATPYMEPLPFRDQHDFRIWAFDKVYTSLMPTILNDLPKKSARATLRKISSSPMTRQEFSDMVGDYGSPLSKVSSTPSVLWLISHCVNNRNVSSSMIPMFHPRSDNSTNFSRHLSKIVKMSIKSRNPSVNNPVQKQTTNQTEWTSVSENVEDQTNSKIYTFDDFDFTPKRLGSRKEFTRKLPDTFESHEYEVQTMEDASPDTTTNITQEISSNDGTKHSGSHELLLKELGLKSVWDEIEAMPKEEQLQYALNVLAEMGDPLAQLPKIQKLPSVQRWLELRQGKKRILTKNQKEELLTLSRGMWKSNKTANTKEVPKIKCTKREARRLTWDNKHWLTSEVSKELQTYFTRLKTDKVNNARSFFPTMLNHYDYGSNLNRNFRDVYFTYLPAREADLLALRPWKTNETVGSRQ